MDEHGMASREPDPTSSQETLPPMYGKRLIGDRILVELCPKWQSKPFDEILLPLFGSNTKMLQAAVSIDINFASLPLSHKSKRLWPDCFL